MAEREAAGGGECVMDDPAVRSVSSIIGSMASTPPSTMVACRSICNRWRAVVSAPPRCRALNDRVRNIPTLQCRCSRCRTSPSRTGSAVRTIPVHAGQHRCARSAEWTPKLVEHLSSCRRLLMFSTELQRNGLQAYVEIDRDAASRWLVTVAAINNALYNAFGQRLISTIFTQASQYRVVLERRTGHRVRQPTTGPRSLRRSMCRAPSLASPRRCPSSRWPAGGRTASRLRVNKLNQFPAPRCRSTSREGRFGSAKRAGDPATEQALGMPASIRRQFQGAALAFRASLANRCG